MYKNSIETINNNLDSIGNQIIGRFIELSCLVEEDKCQFNHIGHYEFESDCGLGGMNLYIDFKESNIIDKRIKRVGGVKSGIFKISLKEGFVSWNDLFNIIDFTMFKLCDENGIYIDDLKVVEDENEIGKYCIKSFISCN
jgi:hypothetical protein